MKTQTDRDRDDLPDEDELIRGAKEAVKVAIRELHDRGIATTHLIDGRIVVVHPDGQREDRGVPTRQ